MNTIEILQKLLQINSVNPPGNELAVVLFLQQFVEQHTFGKCVIQTVAENRANLLVFFGDHPKYLFNNHIDVVDIGKEQDWKYPPFGGEVSDGKVYGRGACDVKGSLACMLSAMVEKEPQNTLFLFSADEEQTGTGIKKFIESEYRNGVEEALIAEPTNNEIIVAHMGITGLEVTFEGKASHSSKPELGNNAIYLANHFINELQKYYQTVLSQKTNEFLGAGVMSIGFIEGGKNTAIVNTVPDKCFLKIDFRYVPEYDAQAILAGVSAIVSKDDKLKTTTRVKQIYRFPSFQSNIATHSMIPKIQSVDSKYQTAGVRYYTEAADLQEAGLNCIIFGAGSIDRAHQVDEFVEIEALEETTVVFKELLKSL